MTTLTLDGIVRVELDGDGHIARAGRIGNGPDLTEWSELPVVLRVQLARRVQIARHTVILPDNRPHSYLRGCIDGVDCTGHTVGELLAAFAAGAESIDWVDDPQLEAYRASTLLSVDKGIPSHIEENDYDGFDVVTDNGKRFSFRRK
jgi:hypothetical protein